jgi:hypothetical protein
MIWPEKKSWQSGVDEFCELFKNGQLPTTPVFCRRCDHPKTAHVEIDGVGLVCPIAAMTFDPR